MTEIGGALERLRNIGAGDPGGGFAEGRVRADWHTLESMARLMADTQQTLDDLRAQVARGASPAATSILGDNVVGVGMTGKFARRATADQYSFDAVIGAYARQFERARVAFARALDEYAGIDEQYVREFRRPGE